MSLHTGTSVWRQLRRHGWKHWTIVLVLTFLGSYIGHLLSHNNNGLIELRYAAYNATMKPLRARGPLYPKRTAIVFIGNDEYWSETLAGRVPIKHDYLGQLIEKVAEAKPAVIAVDFDLRRTTKDGSIYKDYATEDAKLQESIRKASQRTTVVLPVTVQLNEDGDYVCQPSVLDSACECAPSGHCGYIQLPFDLRRVPLALKTASGHPVDSFAGAIVKAVDEEGYGRMENAGRNALPFGAYLSETEFENSRRVLSAGDVLKMDAQELEPTLAHRVVFVGGKWNSLGYRTGPRVDEHSAPMGRTPGAMLHANYVEAALDQRIFRPLDETTVEILEVLTVLGLAVLAALEMSTITKCVHFITAFAVFLICTYVLLQNLGIFLDFFIPALILGVHLAADKVLHWRHSAKHHRAGAEA
jgi:CHASE2 domain-containing sensor protein